MKTILLFFFFHICSFRKFESEIFMMQFISEVFWRNSRILFKDAGKIALIAKMELFRNRSDAFIRMS